MGCVEAWSVSPASPSSPCDLLNNCNESLNSRSPTRRLEAWKWITPCFQFLCRRNFEEAQIFFLCCAKTQRVCKRITTSVPLCLISLRYFSFFTCWNTIIFSALEWREVRFGQDARTIMLRVYSGRSTRTKILKAFVYDGAEMLWQNVTHSRATQRMDHADAARPVGRVSMVHALRRVSMVGRRSRQLNTFAAG